MARVGSGQDPPVRVVEPFWGVPRAPVYRASGETKCYEQYGTWRPDNTGAWECINDVAPGYTWRDRIGSQVRARRIQVRAHVVWGNAHNSVSNLRVMVFLDRQCKGVTPTLAEMFWTVSAVYMEGPQPLYWIYHDRFIPIYDKTFSCSLSYGGANVGNDKTQFMELDTECDIVTNYKGSAGTVADIADNGLFLFAYSADAPASVNLSYLNW